jgi:hypothetical protein
MRIGTSNRSEPNAHEAAQYRRVKRGLVDFGVAVTLMSAAVETLAKDFDKMVGKSRALGCDHCGLAFRRCRSWVIFTCTYKAVIQKCSVLWIKVRPYCLLIHGSGL